MSEETIETPVTTPKPDEDVVRLRQEAAMSAQWIAEIDRVVKFDEEALKQVAKDRAYARGETAFRVSTNVIGSYIDAWVSLLYARNPDIDVMPTKRLEAKKLPNDPGAGVIGVIAKVVEMIHPPQGDPALMSSGLPNKQQDAIDFAKTLQLILQRLWTKAGIKSQARAWVRAALTSKVGWLKASWQERSGTDPVTEGALNDLQDNLARIATMQEAMAEGDTCDYDMQKMELEEAIAGLQAKVEVVIARGLCIDPVALEDIIVSDAAPCISRYLESPWIAHRIYMRPEDAAVLCPTIELKKLKACATYYAKKPAKKRNESPAQRDGERSADEVSAYTQGDLPGSAGECPLLCMFEVWDRDKDQVLTLIRGLDRYGKQPYSPDPTSSRFYPFFGLIFTDVDGQRWPQSLNERSQPLQDEYDRARDAFSEHRRRVKPKLVFNKAMLTEASANALAQGVTAEMVGVEGSSPKVDLRALLLPVQYPQIDPALYSVDHLRSDFELIWGLQEASTGTISTAKTATESEIEHAGTQARTGDKRDALEDALSELAKYTAELSLQEIDTAEAQEMVGPEAFWLDGLTIEDLDKMASVEIRAGSSGKPNTEAQRQSWGAVLPMLQGMIQTIGMLRQSTPMEMADKYEELAKETLDRSGERIDISRFIPAAGLPMPAMPGAPVPGGVPMDGAAPAPAQDPGAPPPDPGFPVKVQ